jgi:hypothetical protein
VEVEAGVEAVAAGQAAVVALEGSEAGAVVEEEPVEVGKKFFKLIGIKRFI